MVAVKISAFGGKIPAQDDTLLPENNAAAAENSFLDAGSLQGMRTPTLVHTMSDPANKYAFRIPLISNDRRHIADSFWWEFSDPDTNVLRSVVANDQYERYYFASTTAQPGYNTKARILNGDPNYVLGIPAPGTAPGVAVVGGSGTTEARVYLITWVSTYGEEGPPSPTTSVTGFVNGTWNITITAPTTPDTTNRSLNKVRLYRTITGSTGTTVFYLVAELAIATTTYTDAVSAVTLAGNQILQSTDWGAPPTDLKGMVSMPNGMIAGFRGNEVWFCEPFRPHAWPTAYTASIDAKVVGLGVVGQTLLVLTDGAPQAATGINPANMAFSKIETLETCQSRGSIVSSAQGVFYASPNGIALAAYGSVQNATQQLATKDRWLDLVRPETLRGARIGSSYYGWGTTIDGSFEPTAFETTAFEQKDYDGALNGIYINMVDPRIAWVDLSSTVVTDNVLTDVWCGEVFLIRNGQVLWLDMSSSAIQGTYRWRSKSFQLAEQRNLSVMKVWFDPSVNDPLFSLNPVRNTNAVQTLAADQYGLVRVFANGNLVMTRELRTSGELMRLPTGFKEVFWQFEVEARVRVINFEVGSSVKELKGV